MTDDFIAKLRFLGVTARIKRLSDHLSRDIVSLYRTMDIDIEPSWHLVFLILKERGECSMTGIADSLQLSQPAVTKILNRMHQRGYITVSRDKSDGRKKILRLSRKALKKLPSFEKVWEAGQKSVRELLADNQQFLTSLTEFEKELARKSFVERAKERLAK